jgi:sugar phosphate isomerase/epimerase
MNGTTASLLTLAGTKYGKLPRYGMKVRGMAALDSGITSIGVNLREKLDTDVLYFVNCPELEWINLDEPMSERDYQRIIQFRDELGCTRINVGICKDHLHGKVDLYHTVIRNLHTLADTGLTVAWEPVSFGMGDPSLIYAFLKANFRENGPVGLLYDMWHMYRHSPETRWSGNAELIPWIREVQVSGIPAGRTDPVFPASQNRPLIAESAVDVSMWLKDLVSFGYSGPVSYECPHTTRAHEVLTERAQIAADDMAPLAW